MTANYDEYNSSEKGIPVIKFIYFSVTYTTLQQRVKLLPSVSSPAVLHYVLHTLIHAFISSRIDYRNAVLYGATDAVIRRLQAVLHAAARLITGVRRNDHITPTLRDTLHWLPVSQRIMFKIALMT